MVRDEHGRKVGRNFASLRATFSRHAAPIVEIPPKAELVKAAPVKATPVKTTPLISQPPKPAQPTALAERRQSKYTLFDLFSKPKVERARGYHEPGLDAVPERTPSLKPFIPKQERPQRPPTEKLLVATGIPLRPTTAPQYVPQETAPTNKTHQPEYWDAPPLFQAYPQSVRHGTLQSPVVSTDSLTRQHTLRKQVGIFGSTSSLPFVREDAEGEQGQEGSKLVPRRYSSINETPELVDKIFVLVTAGRLVQYAGDGNYDRMPEKVLQLGEKSAAYACDLIPGKHWVVQVAQQVNADGGNQINKSRSILSRLRAPAASRKSTTTFLMVFSSAEDMDGWLKAIRSVIEDLGGAKRKYDGEARVVKPKTEEDAAEEELSHRYRVSRPPSMISTSASTHRPRSMSSFSQPRSPRSPVEMEHPPIPTGTHISQHNTPGNSPREANFPEAIQQSRIGTATENESLEASVASSDQTRLDRLSRNSVISIRTSRTSETENVTVPTSKCSSSPPSPHTETFPEQETTKLIPLRTSYIASTSSTRRMSIQPADSPIDKDLNVAQVETVARIQRSSAEENQGREFKLIEPRTSHAPSIVLENPRSRTSQYYSQTLPARMERPSYLSSEFKESWNRDRPDSVVGQLPSISTRTFGRLDSVSKPRRPLSRMLPVRPSGYSGSVDMSSVDTVSLPRRFSSLPGTRQSSPNGSPEAGTPSTTSSAFPNTSASSTPPVQRPRAPSYTFTPSTQPNAPQMAQARALRRPTSMQIRTDHAPFLSQRRPSVTTRSTAAPPASNSYFAGSSPSNNFLPTLNPMGSNSITMRTNFIPFDNSAMPMAITTSTATPIITPGEVPPPIPPMNPNRPAVRARTSMPVMMLSGLPPPPGLPPNMPLPSPPPNYPLPPPPMQAV